MSTYETETYRGCQMVAKVSEIAAGGFAIDFQTIKWPEESPKELVKIDVQSNWFPTLGSARRAAFSTMKLRIGSRPW
ncbi:hypothetical protein SB768_07495 [Burkholderia sp. SIMBA_043]|uniref:hypothetical protein n=1 Tax=Burkholderia TaxID=32008 RepID=UPI0005D95489|nr:hypothetical protein [Burkholderia vietnamiensis]AJY05461.1 hypothetical protein AK36_2148 [Burkholderia vietnamiensis LMG 10929]AVR17304.1 hypothetical protein A8H33_29190 [Burkholderia vietnamiensis]KVM43111.1 hypothetical protein WJ57_28260 [Burkholderia vietnamiensis]KVS06416.1 hypothetical protein WK30_00935 [Burkholderia vietnamiensis]UBI27448.1 hypothetical protein LA325_14795 [Burkholderia vietnamiensis]